MNRTSMLKSLRLNRPRRFGTLAQNLNLSVKMLSPQNSQELYMQLRPLVRNDTVRRVLFSGDALPMRALAAYNYV
jgi:hypothetical protein